MTTLDILYEDHRALLVVAHELTAVTRALRPPSEEELLSLRHALARQVRIHLEREVVLVLMPLQNSPDPHHQTLARLYSEGLLRMRLASSAHHGRWSLPAALANMTGYRHAVRTLVVGLAERIAWEEAEVLPAVEAMLVLRAAA